MKPWELKARKMKKKPMPSWSTFRVDEPMACQELLHHPIGKEEEAVAAIRSQTMGEYSTVKHFYCSAPFYTRINCFCCTFVPNMAKLLQKIWAPMELREEMGEEGRKY
jgi:3'-phosphoadenosine 5'-phosphosulfate sulfotransferase (PAPS reductase)/FAD synthetase